MFCADFLAPPLDLGPDILLCILQSEIIYLMYYVPLLPLFLLKIFFFLCIYTSAAPQEYKFQPVNLVSEYNNRLRGYEAHA